MPPIEPGAFTASVESCGGGTRGGGHLQLEFVLGVSSPQQHTLQDGPQLWNDHLHGQSHCHNLHSSRPESEQDPHETCCTRGQYAEVS